MLRLLHQATRGRRRFRLTDLLANITSTFPDVLPLFGQRYIVGVGRPHSMPRAAGIITSGVAPDRQFSVTAKAT
jgi:hypothetical protein